MGKHRRGLRWDSVERVVTCLVGIASQIANLIDAIHRLR